MLQIEQLILFLFYKMNGLRKRNAPYYILLGKKSGQTIQDVNYYGLHRFFYLLSKKELTHYDRWIQHLLRKGWLSEDEEGWISVTVDPNTFESIEMRGWNGWQYERFEQVYFARLSLAIQTLSYRHESVKRFDPIVPDLAVQQFISQWHRNHSLFDERVVSRLYEELAHLLKIEEQRDALFPIIFVERLTNRQFTGKTYEQLAERLKLNEFDVRLIWVEGMHRLLDRLSQQSAQYPILYSFTKGFEQKLSSVFLTKTAERTYELFQQKYTLEQIAEKRRLKVSTIQDHVIEIAYTVDVFPYERFIEPALFEQIRQQLSNRKDRPLKELKEQYPMLSYFQIRLILTSL